MLTMISSMATRSLLADMAAAWHGEGGMAVSIESVGGVDAARRVQAGEAFDLVVLAADAIDKLSASGLVLASSRGDLVHSAVAAAVRAGAARPDIGSETALREAVSAAASIGYSTGPSRNALLRLFDRWGIAGQIAARTVQAPPGVPVGALVARGEVELGFRQRSELMHLDGIELLGELPEAVKILTTFSAAVCSGSTQREAAAALIGFMRSPVNEAAERRHGMAPAA